MLKRLLILLGMLGMFGVLASVTPASADPAIPFSNDKSERIVGSGSDTVYFVMNSLSEAYNESEGCVQVAPKYPTLGADPAQSTCLAPGSQPAGVVKTENYDHEVAFNLFPVGSSGGRRQLCEQTNPRPGNVDFVSYARSSSAPDVGFQCPNSTGITLRFVAYALDAITWVYWDGQTPAPATDLTQAQLNDIFVDCTITNWNQVGGENAPIEVWTSIQNSGTRASWDSFVGGNSESCIPTQFKNGDLTDGERVIREHVQTPVLTEDRAFDGTPLAPGSDDEQYSIHYTGVGTWTAQPDYQAESNLGSVEGFAPTEANIQSFDFPFSRYMYNVIRQAGPAPLVNASTAGFVGANGWICKPAVQHAKPVGDPGPGTEFALASKNYNEVVLDGIRGDGFIPIRTVGNKCDFIDWVAP